MVHFNWLYCRLAFQNLLRRPTRTFLLIFAVAIGCAAVFATYLIARGIEASIERGFARMGADLIVVPESALVNITSALLTVQPTEDFLEASLLQKLRQIDGIDLVAPQTIYRVPTMSGMPECKANLIAYDPSLDFSVQPWIADRAHKAKMKVGELLSGGRRLEAVAEEIQPCFQPAIVYAKLGRSGVGPLDDSLFGTYETVKQILNSAAASTAGDAESGIPKYRESKVSAFLIRLKYGATPEQVRFAVAKIPGTKVVSGQSIVTATRQTTTLLLLGVIGFTGLMFLGALVLLGLLFSAIISERRTELGLLRAIGARSGEIQGMLLCESTLTTILGGISGLVLGAGLLLLFQHTLVYYLQLLHVDFAWPAWEEMLSSAFSCLGLATLMGVVGAWLPASRISRHDTYSLIQGDTSK